MTTESNHNCVAIKKAKTNKFINRLQLKDGEKKCKSHLLKKYKKKKFCHNYCAPPRKRNTKCKVDSF